MLKTNKIITILIIIIIIVLIIVSAGKKTDNGPIKIGAIIPLTGDAAAYGEPIANAIKLAEKEINDTGGINGRKIEVVYEDGKCNGKDAATAAQKLISIDKVKYMVAGVCSGEVFGYAPITNSAKVLTITPGASNPKISDLGDYVFRNSTNDALRGLIMADWANASFKKIAIITAKTDYAQGVRESFVNRAKEIDLKIVSDEEIAPDLKDFRSIISKIKNIDTDMILLNVQTEPDVIRFAQQAREIGLNQQILISEFNGSGLASAGKSVDGIVSAVAPSLAPDGKSKDFVDSYKKMFSKDPDYAFYGAAAYDDLHLIADAIAKFGDDTDKSKDYWYSLTAYSGALGTYSFDKNGDIKGVNFVFQKLINGKFDYIK